MQHEPEIAVQAERDTFADAPHFAHPAAVDGRERRVGRTQQKQAPDAHAFERPAGDARFERAQIGGDVR